MAPSDPTGPRFLLEDIFPTVDGGRYPVKRIAGEAVEVWADLLREGHDVLAAELLWRKESETEWRREPMAPDGNDRWRGRFTPPEPGRYLFAVETWTDQYATWRKGLLLKREAGVDVKLEALEGRELFGELNVRDADHKRTIERARRAFDRTHDVDVLLTEEVAAAVAASDPRGDLTRSAAIPLVADRARARAGAWYEMVPRSQGKVPGRHGTFDDCIARLPEIAALGFDVVYLTPIHPIGMTNRKGKNNSLNAGPDDPGSPYAIGSWEGGHDAVHPQLGTLDDFRRFVDACRGLDMEVALDFAIQCSPDHPWVKQHPDWFKQRPDGTDQIRREPAEEIRGHRQPGFLLRRPHRAVAGAARRHPVLGQAGRPHLPRRQSAHQAVPVLGMADPRGAAARSQRAVPGGGLHPAEDHEGPRQARLLAELHLFHLAHPQGRDPGISQRADAASGARLLPAELLRQHAGHPAGPVAEGRAVDVQVAAGARGDAVGQLRHLQRLRAAGARAGPRPRGVHQLRQVRDQGPRLGQARQHQAVYRPAQPAAPRERGAAADRQSAVRAGRRRRGDRLRQGIGRPRQRGGGRDCTERPRSAHILVPLRRYHGRQRRRRPRRSAPSSIW